MNLIEFGFAWRLSPTLPCPFSSGRGLHQLEILPPIAVCPTVDLLTSEAADAGKSLPARFLPPGRLQELFEFYEQSSPEGHAALTTFSRCFRKFWKRAIVFRHEGTHSRCTVCAKYSQQRLLCVRPEQKEAVKFEQAQHIREVFLDRGVYARMQRMCEESCRATGYKDDRASETSVLTVAIDGMDQVTPPVWSPTRTEYCWQPAGCSVKRAVRRATRGGRSDKLG